MSAPQVQVSAEEKQKFIFASEGFPKRGAGPF
jgi:hypothetical protein